MGLRFRKTFSLGKLLRLNASLSGLSASVGPRGASVNFGPKGVRTTVGLPGTGLSYSQTAVWPKAVAGSTERKSSGGIAMVLFIILAVVLVAFIAWTLPGFQTKGKRQAAVEPAAPAAIAMTPAGPGPAPPAARAPDRPLTRNEIRALQGLLRKQGFDPGKSDGIVGPKTRAAVRAFAKAHAIKAGNWPTLRVLEAARGG